MRHGIDLKPIHNVKEAGKSRIPGHRIASGRISFPSLECCVPGGARRDRTDDLKLAKLALSQLSYGPVEPGNQGMVGRGGLEPPTSPLSGVRSNHLSYQPIPIPRRPNGRGRPNPPKAQERASSGI